LPCRGNLTASGTSVLQSKTLVKFLLRGLTFTYVWPIILVSMKTLKLKTPRPGDPLFYLGISAIFLFGLLCFVPCSSPGAIFLASALPGPFVSQSCDSNMVSSQNFFLGRADSLPPESPDLLTVQGMSILAVSPPSTVNPKVLGAVVGTDNADNLNKEIIEYTVEQGDTLVGLADRFGISVNSILWANNLSNGTALKVGQKLIIPPVSGVIYYVKAGDTVASVAQKYKAKADDIIDFNDLGLSADIAVGDIIVIPDGVMPQSVAVSTAPALVPVASSYFICPINAPCRKTQGLHWYNAVDLSHGQCGEPIFAAAGGTVLKVRLTESTSPWAFSGGGNHITIMHPNGVVTYYGHLASAAVKEGDTVLQGQIIGFMGGTPGTPGAGKSTGCHLHFAVYGGQNPFR